MHRLQGWARYRGTPPLLFDLLKDVDAVGEPLFRCDIAEEAVVITGAEFEKRYRSKRRPVVLRGAGKHLGLFTKWTKQYITEAAGSYAPDIGQIPYSGADGEQYTGEAGTHSPSIACSCAHARVCE